MRTDSKHLAGKISDFQSHLCKLEIDLTENWNINGNHINKQNITFER